MAKAKPGLLDRLKATTKARPRTGRICLVCALPKDVVAWINDSLKTGAETQASIGYALRKEGHKIQDHSVGNHARHHIS